MDGDKADEKPEQEPDQVKAEEEDKVAEQAESKEKEDKVAEKAPETSQPVEPAETPAPPVPKPEIKLSQILPLVVMFGLQKFDIEKLGYRRHAEVMFGLVQVICLSLIYLIYQRITALSDSGPKLKIPEVKQFGQVVTPAMEQTAKEYDITKLKEQGKQALIGATILSGVYYKWGYLMPLVLQILMTPMQLYESPLFQIHLMGKDVKRPFPKDNPFGMPAAPEPPAQPVEEKKDQ